MADRVRDYERYGIRWAIRRQKEEQGSIKARYESMRDKADSDFMSDDSDLRFQLGQATGNPEKQREISKQLKELRRSHDIQIESIDDAERQSLSRTANLDNYMGGYNEEQYNRMKAEDEQRLNDSIAKARSGDFLGGLKTYLSKKKTSQSGNEEKKSTETDSKQQETSENGSKQDNGGTFDSGRLVFGEDKNGEKKFSVFNANQDLMYHPSLDAAAAMEKPGEKEKPDEKPDEKEDEDERHDYGMAFGLGRYLANRAFAKDKDPMWRSARLRRQAEMHDIEAGDHQRAMQQNLQVANRDYRGEAEKNAASQAAAENAQKVHNLGNAGAGAAALERDVKSADYNTHMQRSDTQRAEGIKNMEKMHDDRQVAEKERSGADVYDYTVRDMNDYNARSGWLSMGGPQSDKRNEAPQKKEEAPKPEEKAEETAPKSDERIRNANAQMVINWYLGARQSDSDPEQAEALDENEQALFDYMSEKYPKVKPVPSTQSVREPYYKRLGVDVSRNNPDNNKWAKATAAWSKSDDEYGKAADKQEVLDVLDNWRGGNKVEGQAEKQTTDEGYTVENTGGEEWEGKRR